MNIVRQMLADTLDDVAAEKTEEAVSLGSAQDQERRSHGGGDVHDGVGD
jgi:hypothetical protein